MAQTPQSLHILVAEDNPVNQKVMRAMLERLGHTAEVADDGLEALEAVAAGSFDVVLMDVQMPRMDGLVATAELRKTHPIGTLRIIAVTANAMPEDQRRCLDAGMDDYIAKPVMMEDLDAALQNQASTVTQPIQTPLPEQEPPVDFQVLSDLTLAIGEPRTAEVLDTFLVNGAAIVDEMTIELAAGDVDAVGMLAHRFKGSSSVVGAQKLARLCASLHELVRAGAANVDIEPVRAEFERVRATLAEYRSGI